MAGELEFVKNEFEGYVGRGHRGPRPDEPPMPIAKLWRVVSDCGRWPSRRLRAAKVGSSGMQYAAAELDVPQLGTDR
jgi:hypothetical protein